MPDKTIPCSRHSITEKIPSCMPNVTVVYPSPSPSAPPDSFPNSTIMPPGSIPGKALTKICFFISFSDHPLIIAITTENPARTSNSQREICFFLISCMLIQISSPSVTTHCIPYTTVLFPFNHSNIRLKAVFYLFCSYASDNRLSLRELPIV